MLSLGSQYIERSPYWGSVWRFESQRRICTDLHVDTHRHMEFFDCEGKKWAELEGRYWTTEPNYSWNGCTPKMWIGRWVGTPDPIQTRHASFVHDQLCQFFNTTDFPFTKHQVDQIFLRLMQEDRFRYAHLYYQAVNRLGAYKKEEPCETSRIILD